MFFKNRKLIIITICIVILCFIGSVIVIFTNKVIDKTPKISNEYIKSLQEIYKVDKDTIINLYNESNDWAKVGKELLDRRTKIPDDKVKELYYQGVKLKDMQQAEHYATLCTVPVLEIMQMKIDLKSWKKVVSELKLDTRPDFIKLGLSMDQVNRLKQLKIDDLQLNEFATLIDQDVITFKELLPKIEQSKKENINALIKSLKQKLEVK